MTGRDCDIAIAGGGLAGGLIALALAQQCPDITFRLIEAGAEPGGNHRWSWFASDLAEDARTLLHPIRTTVWEQGNEVHFPGHRRQLAWNQAHGAQHLGHGRQQRGTGLGATGRVAQRGAGWALGNSSFPAAFGRRMVQGEWNSVRIWRMAICRMSDSCCA